MLYQSLEKNPRQEVSFSSRFTKELRSAPKFVVEAFYEQLQLYLDSPNHPSLRIHRLTKQYADYHSMDVTGDWRALYIIRPRKTNLALKFTRLGTHHQLYQ